MVSGVFKPENARSVQFPQVSPWQENGNLLAYIKKTPRPNKSYLVGTTTGHQGTEPYL